MSVGRRMGFDHKVKKPLSRVIKLRCVPIKKFSAKKKTPPSPKNGPKWTKIAI